MLGGTTHKAQIVDSPVADPTHGAVLEPSATGTDVYGGRLKK